MKEIYGHQFYQSRHQKTQYAAEVILSIVRNNFPNIQTAVDFGCGVGTWLSVFKQNGAQEILGIDGPWVDKKLLQIDSSEFKEAQFNTSISLPIKYDLAISLEVAEHLPPSFAKKFVSNLTNAAPIVLFSAAIPMQGGQGHLNEQWPDYWIDLFKSQNYIAIDCIRKNIWDEEKIPAWYRQNTFIYVEKEVAEKNKIKAYDGSMLPARLVHPDTFQSNLTRSYTIKESFTLLIKAIKNRFNR